MENIVRQAVYSIPKLELEQYSKTNGITVEELYDSLDNLLDDNLRQLFLNRYPLSQDKNKNEELDGKNIIKQILKIKHIKLKEISDTYGISKRHLLRIIKKVETTDPELYNLYKKFRKNELTNEEEHYIEEMPIEDIKNTKRSYALPKMITRKTHDIETIFKTKDEIQEEIYSQIAEKCEDPEELDEKLNNPDTQKMVMNRWKKEKVLIEYFEKECDNNYELFHIALGNKKIMDSLQEKFKKIDEEDGMLEIYKRKYQIEEK